MTVYQFSPNTFSELVFENDIAAKKLERYVYGKSKGNILLHGPYGSAKSTAARVVAGEVNKTCSKILFEFEPYVINGANFSETTMDAILGSWQMAGGNGCYVIIDEVDVIARASQTKLRSFMDQYFMNHILFTTNNLDNVDRAIQSRCDVIEMPALTPQTVLPVCRRIFDAEGVPLADAEILEAICHEDGDLRSILRQVNAIIEDVNMRKAI